MTPSWMPAVQGLWSRVTGDAGPLHLSPLHLSPLHLSPLHLSPLRPSPPHPSPPHPSPLPGPRQYEVRAEPGALHVAASDGVSACVGIHRYLREGAGIRVTWDTDLPLRLDTLPEAPLVRGQARVAEFYYLNFCSFGYSTAYWDWPEWEREIDWMAMHGVTMPLQLVGHEATLELAYSRLGMTGEQIRSFLGGPEYLPWVYMGCLDSFAGPLPAGWIPRHLALGRRILERQRAFGMRPVLPAFTGHAPAQLAPAGSRTRRWQGMETTVVSPSEPAFRRLTAAVVAAQRELFGTDHRYAADPFIEMVPADTDAAAGYPAAVAAGIVDGLRAADPDATWVLQSWPFSYQRDYWTRERVGGFLDGMPAGAVLILDLWGEADPQWERLDGYGGRSWIWNGLLNFGGRSEPVADLQSCDHNLAAALAAGRPPGGLGLTMEAIHNNPAFFELITDRAWSAEPGGAGAWLRQFGRQRYASSGPPTDRAWDALGASVLNGSSQSIFPERFISVVVSRPDYARMLDPDQDVEAEVRAAMFYPPGELVSACRTLRDAVSPHPSQSAALEQDLVLSCVALLLRLIDHRFCRLRGAALRTGRVDAGVAASFLDAFDDLDALVATCPAMRLENWVGAARRWADAPATRRMLAQNARRILTVWNTPEQRELDDYSARIWSGLVAGYYRRRWELWLRLLPQALQPGGRPAAQAALDAELARLAESFIATGPASAQQPAGDARAAAGRVLDRYGDEFLTIPTDS